LSIEKGFRGGLGVQLRGERFEGVMVEKWANDRLEGSQKGFVRLG